MPGAGQAAVLEAVAAGPEATRSGAAAAWAAGGAGAGARSGGAACGVPVVDAADDGATGVGREAGFVVATGEPVDGPACGAPVVGGGADIGSVDPGERVGWPGTGARSAWSWGDTPDGEDSPEGGGGFEAGTRAG